jgi:hypothetical protein
MNSRTLGELGIALVSLGGLAIAVGAWSVLSAERRGAQMNRRRERGMNLLGGLLVGVGAALQLIAILSR